MAKSVIKRVYNTPDAISTGVVTFHEVDNESNEIKFDIAGLIGGSDAYEALTPYGKWSLMRDANNTLGDTFAGDPASFKAASQSRYDKFVAGELGRGTGAGGAKAMNDNILAMVKVTGKDEEACREKWLSLSEENDSAGNPVSEDTQSEQDEWKNHPSMVLARKEIRDERAKAKTKDLRAKAKDAPALSF